MDVRKQENVALKEIIVKDEKKPMNKESKPLKLGNCEIPNDSINKVGIWVITLIMVFFLVICLVIRLVIERYGDYIKELLMIIYHN